MSSASDGLERIASAVEVEIVTQPLDGPAHRTVVWAVVDDGESFVRSYRGAAARWYREALANPAVTLRVNGRSLPATAIPATDPDSIERTSRAFLAKYAGDPAVGEIATQHHDTTLRLEPT